MNMSWNRIKELTNGLGLPEAPAPCADIAAEYEKDGQYELAAAVWYVASARCLGHSRGCRYENAGYRCLKKNENGD
jgi:hypothetical protein